MQPHREGRGLKVVAYIYGLQGKFWWILMLVFWTLKSLLKVRIRNTKWVYLTQVKTDILLLLLLVTLKDFCFKNLFIDERWTIGRRHPLLYFKRRWLLKSIKMLPWKRKSFLCIFFSFSLLPSFLSLFFLFISPFFRTFHFFPFFIVYICH